MADVIYQPTPPAREAGPVIEIPVDLVSTDKLKIIPGQFKGIPQYWELLDLYLKIATDATVANRYMYVELLKSLIASDVRISAWSSAAVAASSSNSMMFGKMTYNASVSGLVGGYVGLDLLICDQNNLQIYMNTGKAGDSLTGIVRLLYVNPKYDLPTPYDE